MAMRQAIYSSLGKVHDPLGTKWYKPCFPDVTDAAVSPPDTPICQINTAAPFYYAAWGAWVTNMMMAQSLGCSEALKFDKIAECLSGLETSLTGYRLWQKTALPQMQKHLNLLWQEGASELRASKPGPVECLLLPSMINGSEILDLHPQASIYRAADAQKPTGIFSWGNVGFAERHFKTSDYFNRLARAITDNGAAVDLVGYCMGGTLALDFAAKYPDLVRSVITLGAPVNFHHDQGQISVLSRQIAAMTPHQQACFFQPFDVAYGVVPGVVIQMLFAALNPLQLTEKFRVRPNSARDSLFMALEAWANTPVNLPVPLVHEICDRWMRQNQAVENKINQNIPVTAIAGTRDHIAPPASTLAISDIAPHVKYLTYPLGHVGLLIGKKARKDIWPTLFNTKKPR